jgi:hypothetical protein
LYRYTTASSPEEGVLNAVLEAIGPLRAAAISVSSGNESIDGSEMRNFEGYTAPAAASARDAAAEGGAGAGAGAGAAVGLCRLNQVDP